MPEDEKKMKKVVIVILSLIFILIFLGLAVISVFQYSQIQELKIAFKQDSHLKAIQIQRLDAGISFQNKKRQFIVLARDSIIMKHNKDISHEEAYDIAEFNLYVSEKYKLDPVLLLAIQRQESAFRNKAKSEAGAIGLNQIWPLTGRMLCDIAGMEYYKELLYDSKINTELAAIYLTYLKAEYQKLDYILIGYNAGPRWIYYYKTGKHKLPQETVKYITAVKKFYSQFDEKLAIYLPGNIMKVTNEEFEIDINEKEVKKDKG